MVDPLFPTITSGVEDCAAVSLKYFERNVLPLHVSLHLIEVFIAAENVDQGLSIGLRPRRLDAVVEAEQVLDFEEEAI
jgi:hypothetical protein